MNDRLKTSDLCKEKCQDGECGWPGSSEGCGGCCGCLGGCRLGWVELQEREEVRG